jgi:hypothetical protein
MRLIIATLAATILMGFASGTTRADPYQWCANYGPDEGSTNCYFITLQQCQAAVSGVGGFCARNNFYDGRAEEDPAPRRSKKREPH